MVYAQIGTSPDWVLNLFRVRLGFRVMDRVCSGKGWHRVRVGIRVRFRGSRTEVVEDRQRRKPYARQFGNG